MPADSSISQSKQSALLKRMEELGVYEKDIVEDFIQGSGPGGQKINKTSSCVRLKHIPSGLEVKCQAGRSQSMNRFLARRLLCDKIAELFFKQKSEARKKQEKIKRQKRRRSRKSKEKILSDKKIKGKLKKNRRASRNADFGRHE